MTQQPVPYYRAARFASKDTAGRAYMPLQALVYDEQNVCDLSVFRFRITEGWHVVVLGKKPSNALCIRIEALLAKGTLVTLASRPDVLDYLQRRRARAENIAPWVEVHYKHDEE